MQKRSTSKSKSTRGPGKNISPRRKQQEKISSSRISATRRTGPRGASGNAYASFLTPDLKPENIFVIQDGSLFDNTKHDPAGIPDTLVFLYGCLKTIPGFKDTKHWKNLPSLQQLADYFSDQLNHLCEKQDWSFGTNEGKRKLYFQRELNDESRVVPLEWLEKIKEYDQALYDLTLMAIRLVARSWDLEVVFTRHNDIIFDELENQIEDIDEERWIQKELADYKTGGEAFELSRHVTFHKNALSVFVRRLGKYTKPDNKIMLRIYEWLLTTQDVCKNSKPIDWYYFNRQEDEDCGLPINAMDMFGFQWSFCDLVAQETDDWLSSIANEAGIVGPLIRTEFSPNKKPQTSASIDAIIALTKWAEEARSIYFDNYHQEYQDKHSKPLFNDEEEQEDEYDLPIIKNYP